MRNAFHYATTMTSPLPPPVSEYDSDHERGDTFKRTSLKYRIDKPSINTSFGRGLIWPPSALSPHSGQYSAPSPPTRSPVYGTRYLTSVASTGPLVDFTRTDVSLISQLLQNAETVSERRQAQYNVNANQHEYTRVCCVPTSDIIHSLLANLTNPAERRRNRSTSGLNSQQGMSSARNRRSTGLSGSVSPNVNREAPSPRMSDAAAVHKIGQATGEKIGTCHVSSANIAYPDHWCPPSTMPLSPFHNAKNQHSEVEIIEWCTAILGHGVVTASMRHRLMELESAKWAAFLAPFAGDEYVTLIGRFLAIFVVIDDKLVEEATALGLTAAQMAPFHRVWGEGLNRARGDTAATDELYDEIKMLGIEMNNLLVLPCLDAFCRLSDDYVSRGADATWCQRMAEVVEEYIILGIREAQAAAKINEASLERTHESQPLPPVAMPMTRYDHQSLHAASAANNGRITGMHVMEILARQRVATIGWPMLVLQLERASGLCFNQTIATLFQPAIQLSAILPALVNELVGLARDLREGDTLVSANFSLVQRRLFNCSLSQSIDFTLALHSQTVAAFDTKAAQILANPSVTASPSLLARLAVFLDRLRNGVRGYAHWHHHAARYKSVMAVDMTEHACFIFPVQDGEGDLHRATAIADTIQQYQIHTIKH